MGGGGGGTYIEFSGLIVLTFCTWLIRAGARIVSKMLLVLASLTIPHVFEWLYFNVLSIIILWHFGHSVKLEVFTVFLKSVSIGFSITASTACNGSTTSGSIIACSGSIASNGATTCCSIIACGGSTTCCSIIASPATSSTEISTTCFFWF